MKARDVMQTDVKTVTPSMTIQELLGVLSDNDISGAPVVTDDQRVAGVVSATDVIRFVANMQEIPAGDTSVDPEGRAPEEAIEDGASAFFWDPEQAHPLAGAGLQTFEAVDLDAATVGDIMTTAAFTVSPDQDVREVAVFLLQGRIHRALVEEDGRLLGLVTTFDLLRALVEH